MPGTERQNSCPQTEVTAKKQHSASYPRRQFGQQRPRHPCAALRGTAATDGGWGTAGAMGDSRPLRERCGPAGAQIRSLPAQRERSATITRRFPVC